MSSPRIGIVLGSKSDLSQMEGAEQFLREVGVPYEMRIISAHRTPDKAHEYAKTAKDRGIEIIIAVAGMAAHLAGVLAASADVPILGVPSRGGALEGFDALLATVQMPAGCPVATFAIGKAGGTNAAIFACQMLAMADEHVASQVRGFRAAMRTKVEADDESVQRDR